jgi:hypothetical protein
LLFARFCVVASTSSMRPSPHQLSPPRHTTFVRLHGTPPPFGCGDIFGGNLGATSLRDTVFFGTLQVGHTTSSAFGHTMAFGHPWALGSTHPDPQPRRQYRTSFPKPPLWETPQSPQPPRLAPGQTTTTSDGAACLAVTPPPPTAPAVPHLLRSTSTTDGC